jgi:penicillin-binding protein 1C
MMLRWVLAAVLLLGVADRVFPPDLSRARMLSAELRDASGRVLNLRPAADGAVRLAAGPDDVGRDIVPLLLAREDRRFRLMPGVDPLALLRAAGQVAAHGRIVSGGSTIAMQVARLLEPHPRSLWGKLHDIARGSQLQAHLGRDEMLRLYLTLAPMGGNLEGVRAASLLYFGCEPAALTRSQAALIVSLPQSPARRRPDLHPDAAWQGAGRVLAAAGDAMPPARTAVARAVLPGLARHLAGHWTGVTTTTLDADLQAGVEALATRELRWLGADADVAAIVIRNRDRAVLAYLGGVRFMAPGGMVDMVRARRSPGSALKPFIYAMAFDAGLAAPGTILPDDAFRLGGYAPRDFDRVDHGAVTAAEALRQSLNRPAVRLLSRLGPARFDSAVARAGVHLVLPPGGEVSAALALGGAGISLFDLAGLYADLADGGVVQAPSVAGATAPSGTLVSRRAAADVAAILRAQPAPPGAAPDPAHPIAYKTGTSYGFRDAWAAGFTPAYTVVVWVGRRDNTPLPGATGRDVAAPILFHLFGLLPAEPAVPDVSPDAAAPVAPALARLSGQPALRMMFPPGDVDLAYDPAAPIDLRAAGGQPPYRWLADGRPLPPAPHTLWSPDGPGFVHLTVVDRAGHSASADVRLVAE